MQRNRVSWGFLLVVALTALLLAACELNVSATRTPSFTQGSTVFSVIRWREPDTAIDVVFFPDDDYGNLADVAQRQVFLNDVANLIDEGFWQSNAIVRNIGMFNFWFSTNTGNVAPNTSGGICPNVTWPNMTDASFAEVKVLVHPNELRDCRWGTQVTTEPGSFRTVVHEFGHAAFNLRDEYCCDGGYGILAPVMYDEVAPCNADAANAAWRDCDSFNASNGEDWVRSEDSIVDIMAAGGSVVVEFGQGDWAVLNSVLGALGAGTVNVPEVFAPDPWDWP